MNVRANKPFAPYVASRRVQLLNLLSKGDTVEAIAALRLYISKRTVRRNTRWLCDQTGCRSSAHLGAWAVTNQLISPHVPSAETATLAARREGGWQ